MICLALLLNVFGCTTSPVEMGSQGAQSLSKGTESQSTGAENSDPSSQEEMIAKVIWQDPNNVIILWNNDVNYEYIV